MMKSPRAKCRLTVGLVLALACVPATRVAAAQPPAGQPAVASGTRAQDTAELLVHDGGGPAAAGAVRHLSDAPWKALQKLKVDPQGRFLIKEDGTPFFWLGDTAWFLPKLSDQDVIFYLSDRAKKKFNVIQIALQYHEDIKYLGAGPYLGGNTDTPNPTYWNHLDDILTEAEKHGLYVAITIMWAEDYQPTLQGDAQKSHRLGKWMGERYRGRNNVLWIVSGEYEDTKGWSKDIYNAIARGLHEGHQDNHLMTIHPAKLSSSDHFHHEAWLDFNMIQSGHKADREARGLPENHLMIAKDYALTPSKPIIDGESTYEDIAEPGNLKGPRFTDAVVRQKAYWAVFAGAFGHTYGNENVEIIFQPGDDELGFPHRPWQDALDDPGAWQMRHLRSLIESRSFLNRIPDQSILVAAASKGNDHVRSTRASDGNYAMVYIPTGGAVTIDLAPISGGGVKASWFNPRTGVYTPIGQYPNKGHETFDAPGATALGNDWVLVLDSIQRRL